MLYDIWIHTECTKCIHTPGKEKNMCKYLIPNSLRHHEINTSYLWLLQLQEVLKVGSLASKYLLVGPTPA